LGGGRHSRAGGTMHAGIKVSQCMHSCSCWQHVFLMECTIAHTNGKISLVLYSVHPNSRILLVMLTLLGILTLVQTFNGQVHCTFDTYILLLKLPLELGHFYWVSCLLKQTLIGIRTLVGQTFILFSSVNF